MSGTIDYSKLNLRPFKTMERKPSQYFGYDVAVTLQEAEGEMTYSMVEVSQADGANFSYVFVFSQAKADPDRMHSRPGAATSSITHMIQSLSGPKARVLISGLGGGLVHTQLLRSNRAGSSYEVLSLEPDATVIELARRYFQFEGDVSLTTQQDHFRIDPNRDTSVPLESYDVVYINSFCQYVNYKAMDVFDDVDTMDGIVSRLNGVEGKVIVNCFSYLDDPDFSSLREYAKSRGLNYEMLAVMFNGTDKVHNFIVVLSKGDVSHLLKRITDGT